MTVEDTSTSKRYIYSGPGDYSFPFALPSETDLLVKHTTIAGITSTLSLGTDYTIVILDPGGIVTMTYSETTGYLDIQLNIPYTQPQEWENADSFDMSVIERAQDRAILLIQQLRELVTGVTTVSNWRGDWATGIDYVVLDLVRAPGDGNWYQCTATHTAGIFLTDLAAGNWILAINIADIIAPSWPSGIISVVANYAALGTGDAVGELKVTADTGIVWRWIAEPGGAVYAWRQRDLIIADDVTAVPTTNLEEGASIIHRSTGDRHYFDGSSVVNVDARDRGKNLVANPSFDFWSRGSTAVTATGLICDCWRADINGTVTSITPCDLLGSDDVPSIPTYALQADVTMGSSSQYSRVVHRIEDVRTAAGKKLTVSLWTSCSAPRTIAISIWRNYGSGGSTAEYILNGHAKVSALAAWARREATFTIPTTEGKTIGARSYLEIRVWFDNGTDQPAAAIIGHQTGIFYLADVQVEISESASDFQIQTIDEKLRKVQRYIYDHYICDSATGLVGDGHYVSTTAVNFNIQFPVEMRATPTLEYTAGTAQGTTGISSSATLTSPSIRLANKTSAMLTATTATVTANQGCLVFGSTDTKFIFSAEL